MIIQLCKALLFTDSIMHVYSVYLDYFFTWFYCLAYLLSISTMEEELNDDTNLASDRPIPLCLTPHPTRRSCRFNCRQLRCPHPGCGRVFDRASKLEAHRKSHTARFRCEYEGCGKAFVLVSSLNRHLKEEHPYRWVGFDLNFGLSLRGCIWFDLNGSEGISGVFMSYCCGHQPDVIASPTIDEMNNRSTRNPFLLYLIIYSYGNFGRTAFVCFLFLTENTPEWFGSEGKVEVRDVACIPVRDFYCDLDLRSTGLIGGCDWSIEEFHLMM